MTTSSNIDKLIRWPSALIFLLCLFSRIQLSIVTAQAEDDGDVDAQLFEATGNEDVEAAAAALKLGANINALSPRGMQTPLMQSVLHGREKMVRFFLENGADT